ncbi:NUDIX domain-containing protein [Paenibacillus sp. PL2-23]|uniref:NUDIX domain-containing protein n=1 Tax=Paenibacillus sp. PL2-23 TaxID=2100729 RepID=UPI0030F6D5DC
MSYIMDLRKLVGTRPLIMAGSCVLVFNEQGQLLLQRRTDSNDWGTLGGALELGESFEEAAARELHEEAGLTAKSYTFINIAQDTPVFYKRGRNGRSALAEMIFGVFLFSLLC